MSTRHVVAVQTADALQAAMPHLSTHHALVGFDGFVDHIIKVVDKRYSFGEFDAVPTLTEFGNRILRAAGQSSNVELVVQLTKLGGNGPIMANAMSQIGLGLTYVGNLGQTALHPVFQPMTERMKVYTVADPGSTDALEFEDGKLMIGKQQSLAEVTWENLQSVIGREEVQNIINQAEFIACVNWTMLPYMDTIFDGLLEEALPAATERPRTFFFDLADPEKRTRAHLLGVLNTLPKFEAFGRAILGLNLKESTQVAEVLEIEVPEMAEAAIEQTAMAIRKRLGIHAIVIHPRSGAAAATAEGSATFAGPFVREPKLSTGAGDHFNAGFCSGMLLGMGLEHCLCLGTATSGYYVRMGESPTAANLVEFLRDLPEPEVH